MKHSLSRALLISRNFPPLIGGMERLNQNLFIKLSERYEASLIGPTGAMGYASDADRVEMCPVNPVQFFLFCAAAKALPLVYRTRPRLIIAGSGVNAPPAWLAAKACGAKWGIYIHGLDLVVDNILYQRTFLPIIRKADFWIANSRATAVAGREAGLDSSRIHILSPGVGIPEILPSDQSVESWRRSVGAGARKIILSVGRLTNRKGLGEFISNAFPIILRGEPNTLLIVIGNESLGALTKATTSVETLKDAARKVGAEKNICFLGRVSDEELSLAFCSASAHVFPVLDLPGDMEGFGMVAIEAAAHGLPTVAFAVGGVVDAVAEGKSGFLIRKGMYEEFASSVLRLIRLENTGAMKINCKAFAEQFSWENFGIKLHDILNRYEISL